MEGAEGDGEGVLGRQRQVPGQRRRGPCQQGACPGAEGERTIPRQLRGSVMQLRHLPSHCQSCSAPRAPPCRCLCCQGHSMPAPGCPLLPEHQQAWQAQSHGCAHLVQDATEQAEEGWQIFPDISGGGLVHPYLG